MTEKFTRGEWGIVGSGDHGFVYITDNPQKEIQERHIICQVQTNSKHSTIANAALLAAAPRMYNRLKEVKSDFRALLFNPYISEHTKECIKVMIDHIEDDLKKARGEE